eukprot:scaffold2132_cov152-Skeletonema_menzelii.AAC.9
MEVVQTSSNLLDDHVNEDVANTGGTNLVQQDAVEKGQFLVAFERVCSIPSSSQPTSLEEKPKKKTKVNVTVTVVSVAGIHIQDCSKPKKGFMPKKNTSHNRELSSSQTTTSTTITASFSRAGGKMKKKNTPHVASLPVELRDVSPSSAITYWPDQDEASSSYHFQQEWHQDEKGDKKNANKSSSKLPCTVHLAVTNSGRMFNLGRAEILGDKVGESFIDIPIIDEMPSAGKQTRFVKGNRKKMMKLKGVNLKVVLGSNAFLRVKVNVSQPFVHDSGSAAVDPSPYLVYAVPPSRVRSPLRAGSIRKSFSSSTGYHSSSTNTTSKMSSEISHSSMDFGVEIQYNTARSPATNNTTLCLQAAASMSEASMNSYSSAGSDFVSSLDEDHSFFEYDSRLSWRHLLTCNFPLCEVMKQECADIRQIKSHSMDTFEEEDEPSRSSSYVPW